MSTPQGNGTQELPLSTHLNRGSLPNLDGIRAAACILVVISHLNVHKLTFEFGAGGVGIFFVLSGFLMGYLYGHQSWGTDKVLSYSIARFSRIAPIYWLVIGFCVIYSMLDPAFTPQITGFNQIARHFLFGGSVSVYWSIPPEVQYYAFFLVVWLCWSARNKFPTGLIMLIMASAVFVMTQSFWPSLSLPSKLHLFVCGTIAGIAPRLNFSTSKLFPYLQVAAIGMLIIPMVMFHDQATFYTAIATGPLIGVALYLLSYSSRWTNLVFANMPMRLIGRASFSIYLMHIIVIYGALRIFNITLDETISTTTLIALGIAGTVVPMIVSRIIEMPLQSVTRRYLTHFISNIRTKRADTIKLAQPD